MATATKTKVNLRPLGNRIVLRRLESEETTAGGIVLPDNAKEKPREGTVLAVGPGKVTGTGKTIPLTIKAGDRVLFGQWGGTEVKIDGEDLLILGEDEVLGIVG